LVAHREDGGYWTVDALGAPHIGERSEKELIASFVDKIAALSPQLVTFNVKATFSIPIACGCATRLFRGAVVRCRISGERG
jgi:hypothetical protein